MISLVVANLVFLVGVAIVAWHLGHFMFRRTFGQVTTVEKERRVSALAVARLSEEARGAFLAEIARDLTREAMHRNARQAVIRSQCWIYEDPTAHQWIVRVQLGMIEVRHEPTVSHYEGVSHRAA